MRAVVQHAYGPPDVLQLEQVPIPQPSADEVLVRVHAAGLDRGVWHLMTGLPYLLRLGFGFRAPRRPVCGLDVAGQVVEVGANVDAFRPGDEVFGIGTGTFAEYACVPAKKLAPKPVQLSFAEAAAVPVSAMTAWQGLHDHGSVEAGQRVLITGASGGVGTYAVQIAKAAGAHVTGECSAAKADRVRGLGADHVLDYRVDDFTAAAERYDLIFDLGGNRPLLALRRALTPKGTLVIGGGEEGDRWIGGVDRLLRAFALSPWVGQRMGGFIADEGAASLLKVRDAIEAGELRPLIDRTFPMEQAREAMTYLDEGRACGKLVLTVSAPAPSPGQESSPSN